MLMGAESSCRSTPYYMMSQCHTASRKDNVKELAQLIAIHGMETNSDNPGVERIAVSTLRPDAGCVPPFILNVTDVLDKETLAHGGDKLLDPHGVFLVKGYTRTYCMYLVLLCAYELPEFLEAGLDFICRFADCVTEA